MTPRNLIDKILIVITDSIVVVGPCEVVMNTREGFYSFYVAVKPCKVKGFSQFAELVLLDLFARSASVTGVFKPVSIPANRIEQLVDFLAPFGYIGLC